MKHIQCPVCQNYCGYLGTLGDTKWYRCNGCGWETSDDPVYEPVIAITK